MSREGVQYRKKVEKLRLQKIALSKAEKALHNSLKELFPVNAYVRWMHGKHEQSGFVVRHGLGDRLKVENLNTEKHVWIDSYRMIEVYGGDVLVAACSTK